MAIYLKKAAGIEESDVADAKVREIVERIIADVKKRGDAAVRELSEKLDGWSPAAFRLSKSEIESLVGSVANSTIDDIKFAQTQVARFAESQKSALRNLEIETIPGVLLGHRNIPVGSVACYVPGGRYPMVASAHMSVLTAKIAGVERVVACTPPSAASLMPKRLQPCRWPERTKSTLLAEFKRSRRSRSVRNRSLLWT
jgi:sulfopropanediol 3-dehydrogenase